MEYSATHGFYCLMKVKFSRSALVFLNERYLIFLKANLLIICKAKKPMTFLLNRILLRISPTDKAE